MFGRSFERPLASYSPNVQPRSPVPKRNYGFEKRQKELAKIQKRKLKAERPAERSAQSLDEQVPDPPESPASPPPAPEPEE